MTAPRTILVNGFTRLTLDGVSRGEMQIGNPRGVYPIADADRMRPEIEIAVRGLADGGLFDAIYRSPETGYLERSGRNAGKTGTSPAVYRGLGGRYLAAADPSERPRLAIECLTGQG